MTNFRLMLCALVMAGADPDRSNAQEIATDVDLITTAIEALLEEIPPGKIIIDLETETFPQPTRSLGPALVAKLTGSASGLREFGVNRTSREDVRADPASRRARLDGGVGAFLSPLIPPQDGRVARIDIVVTAAGVDPGKLWIRVAEITLEKDGAQGWKVKKIGWIST